eukprot:755207-Hanusia_phi.AAC.5
MSRWLNSVDANADDSMLLLGGEHRPRRRKRLPAARPRNGLEPCATLQLKLGWQGREITQQTRFHSSIVNCPRFSHNHPVGTTALPRPLPSSQCPAASSSDSTAGNLRFCFARSASGAVGPADGMRSVPSRCLGRGD